MSFPAAISGRLDYAVILNSLYFISFQPGQIPHVQRTPLPTFENEPVWKSTTRSMRYAYSYEISENGLYLGLGSSKSWMTRSSLGTQSSIFVFGVVRSRDACEFIATTSVATCDFKFHPELPIIVASSIPASSQATQLALWLFDPKPHSSINVSNVEGNSFGQHGFLQPIYPISRYFQGSFEFSACGRNIILRSRGSLSTVVSVESSCLYQEAVRHQKHRHSLGALAPQVTTASNPPQSASTVSSAISALSSTAIITKFASRFCQDPVVTSAEGQYELRLEHNGKSKSVEVTMDGPNYRAKSHLLSVPDTWADIENGVKPCVITQDSLGCSPSFSVLLTQEPKSSYDPSGPRDFHLPALIQKDVAALLPSTYSPAGPSRKRLPGAIENEGDPNSKRVRRLRLRTSSGPKLIAYEMDEQEEEKPLQS